MKGKDLMNDNNYPLLLCKDEHQSSIMGDDTVDDDNLLLLEVNLCDHQKSCLIYVIKKKVNK